MNEARPPIPTPPGVSLTRSTSLEWLIIGGGIHGVHIAVRLLGESGVSPQHLQIVDPGTRLLERWRKCTDITGMSHLRSPSVHHLDLNPWALRKLAGKRSRTKAGLFAHPYDRPSLNLFNAHCDQLSGANELADLHVQARAMSAEVDCDGVRVTLSNGQEISTQNLVLAVGSSEQPAWPDWAPRSTHHVHHIFDPKFDGWPSCNEPLQSSVVVSQQRKLRFGSGTKVKYTSSRAIPDESISLTAHRAGSA